MPTIANRTKRTRDVETKSPTSMAAALYDMEMVYYVRHLGHVKIGMTMNLPNRLRMLGIGYADVLAYEFGGREVERARHAQFASAHATGDGLTVNEHFHLTPELEAHMTGLMAAAKARASAA